MRKKVVKGICDAYLIREAVDGVSGEKFCEVYSVVEGKDGTIYEDGDWLCDIDTPFDATDEELLNEIDANL